ncbi:MAG: WS/DGAT domain-containing protein [Microthrixaceae bacterium]|nr:WS/DGAT domain-containing protein [Microthrixaceae bacterium]
MNESLRPVHNLVISNVPGPPFPLYLGGAELVAAYPMGPVMDGAGLNITVLSYRNHIDIGFMADRELVPDVWELAEAVQPAFDELLALAEERDPTVTKSAASVTATSKAARRRAAADKKAGAKKAGATKRKAAAKKEPAAKKPASKKAATKKAATEKPASTRKRTVARKKPVATKTAPATVDTVAGAAPAHTVSDTSA